MNRRSVLAALILLVGVAGNTSAQTRLTLADAVTMARTRNVDARIAAESVGEADARVAQATAWYWPRVDFTESWQRGNQPVFVFSSLLSQRRFTAADFDLDNLNYPDPVNNFRSGFLVEQLVFDGGAVRANARAARLGRDAARVMASQVERDLAVAATEAFGRVLMADAAKRAARSAVAAAESDLQRAQARRAAGVVTDADVLAIEVHLARMRAQEIGAAGDETVARTRLNQVIGAPLDERYELDASPAAPDAGTDAAALEREAISARPEIRLAEIQQDVAKTAVSGARAAFLPSVGFQGGWEWNGAEFGTRESSWIVGTQVRFNVFRGFADRARLAEAEHTLARRGLEREKAETNIRLDVRTALARLEAARAREAVGRAALAQAQAAQRILRDRYESGLVGVADLLQAAQATLQAEAQDIASRVDVLTQAAALERALGR
jgi:outer membrane protein TolC